MSEETSVQLSDNAAKILEMIEGMTVLEMSELVKAMEEKFGVSAAAPVAVAAVGGGGWYGYQTFLAGGAAGGGQGTPLPAIPGALMPQMRELSDRAMTRMVEEIAGLPERSSIPDRPDSDWLTGPYLADASGYASIADYWSAVADYLSAAEAAADTPVGEWIVGRGWHQDKWQTPCPRSVGGFPTHEALSRHFAHWQKTGDLIDQCIAGQRQVDAVAPVWAVGGRVSVVAHDPAEDGRGRADILHEAADIGGQATARYLAAGHELHQLVFATVSSNGELISIGTMLDSNGDGKADLTACPPGWGCEKVIAHHFDVYDLTWLYQPAIC